jgi:hypothetical protein
MSVTAEWTIPSRTINPPRGIDPVVVINTKITNLVCIAHF